MGNTEQYKTTKKKEGCYSLFTAFNNTSCVDLKGGKGGVRAIEQHS